MKVTLPYPPSANRYWRHVGRNVVVSKEARLYRRRAASLALSAGMRPVDGPAKVTLEVFRPRKSGDLDNSIKVLMDALRGVAYRDDSQVVEIRAHRWDDKDNPRVEVQVECRNGGGA